MPNPDGQHEQYDQSDHCSQARLQNGELTCLYNSHQVLPFSLTPFQRKTPEIMSASTKRSPINVEKMVILTFGA
jgi:hypothetical protein